MTVTGTEPPEDWITPTSNLTASDPAVAAAGASDRRRPAADEADSAPLECVRLDPVGISNIPPRTWAYGRFLLFGSAGVIGAQDGAGKGTIAAAMVVAFITGRALLGEKVWRSGPVALITFEDDETEWHRRIAAACAHYNGDYAHVMANVYFIRRPGGRVTFADRLLTGKLVFPDSAEIVDHLINIGAVLLIVDPFNNAHNTEDGNNNAVIARVAEEITSIARRSGVAALVLHHLRKGATGQVDDLMGAVALRANFRATRVLARMTAEEAKKLSVTDPWRYLRVASTKANFAPPPLDAIWFRLASIPLSNGMGIYPEGDELGVVESWQPRLIFDGMSAATLRAVFDALRARPHAPDKRAQYAPWVAAPLMQIGGRNSQEAMTIVARWVDNNVLLQDDNYRDEHRHKRRVILVNESKVVEVLAELEVDVNGGVDG
jgi:hypothetical protein